MSQRDRGGHEQEDGEERCTRRGGHGQEQEGGSDQRPGTSQMNHSFAAPPMELPQAVQSVQAALPPDTSTCDQPIPNSFIHLQQQQPRPQLQQHQHQHQGHQKNAPPQLADKEDSAGGGNDGDNIKSKTVNEPLLGIQAIQHNKQQSDSLNIAKPLNRQDIVPVLESHETPVGQSLIDHSQPGPSSNVGRLNPTRHSTDDIDNKMNEKLEEFVKYFVKKFEAKLQAYHIILEGEAKKAGKFSEKFSKLIGKGIGGGIGGACGLFAPFLGQPPSFVGGFKIGAEFGEHTVGPFICELGERHHRNKVISLSKLVYDSMKNKAIVRRILVEAGFDIFQSFEMQFMRVTTDQGHEGALRKLAEDATNRAISYHKQKEEYFITEGVILGKSKIESILGLPIYTSKFKTPGLEIQYQHETFKQKWNTASLYEKVGLIIEGTDPNDPSYYEKQYGKSRTQKYGYRRRFTSELSDGWEGIKEYMDNVLKSSQLKDYQYILDPKSFKEKVEIILLSINQNDKDLEEDRMKEILVQVKDEIKEEINGLKDRIHLDRHEYEDVKEDRRILANIEKNLKELKVDELFKQFVDCSKECKRILQDISKDTKEITHKVESMGHNILALLSEKQIIEKEKSIWFDIKKSVTSFIALSPGRQDILDQVDNSIKNGGVVVISGLDGVGKSELAIKYAHAHSIDYNENAIWINAETQQTIKESFHRLAKEKLKMSIKDIDINEEEKSLKSIIEDVYKYFADRKSLFIFDNAEKFALVENVLTSSLSPSMNKPHVLITSPNNLEWQSNRENRQVLLPLGDFTDEEAIKFIKTTLDIKDDSENEAITELASQLDNFPIALQHATESIKNEKRQCHQRNREFNVRDYITLLSSQPDSYAEEHYKPWKITFEKLKNEEHGKEVLFMLNVMSYLEPNHIPEKMFSSEQKNIIPITTTLEKYSIIRLDNGMLSMHGLVQKVRRSELKEQKEVETTLEKALELLKKQLVDFESVEHYISHVSSVWKYAKVYDNLIKRFIVDDIDDTEAYTTYFHLIAKGSSYEIVEAIINKIEQDNLKKIINAEFKDMGVPLQSAVLSGDERIVTLLIRKGAIVKTGHNRTPLLHLAAQNGYSKVVKVLLGSGADINGQDRLKYTPLHFAVKNNNIEVVQALLEVDEINVNAVTKYNLTPLHFANNFEIVQILLKDTGAKVNAQDRLNYTPLHFAVKNNNFEVVQALLEVDEIDVNAVTKYNLAPLHFAAREGHIQILKALLEKEANVNTKDIGSFTPLHLAAYNNHNEVVNELLKISKIDINPKTTKGNTPLHLAAEKGNFEVVKALIAENADVDIINEEGKVASDLVNGKNDVEIKNYILQHRNKREETISKEDHSKQLTFKRRPGTSGMGGQLYEIELLMLFLLQGITQYNDRNIDSFKLATNIEEAGHFDDVVYIYNKRGIKKPNIVFLQVKHSNSEKRKISIDTLLSQSEKGYLSLRKYFNSFRRIKQLILLNNHPLFKDMESCSFVIYTNAVFNFDKSRDCLKREYVESGDILNLKDDSQEYCYKLNDNEKVMDALRQSQDFEILVEVLAQCFYSGSIDRNIPILKNYHVSLVERVIERKTRTEGKLREEFINGEREEDTEFRSAFIEEIKKKKQFSLKSEDELKKALKRMTIQLPIYFGSASANHLKLPLPTKCSDQEIMEFLRELKLFLGQPNEGELGKIIKHKIQVNYKVEQNDIDTVFADVEYKVRKWWTEGNEFITERNSFIQEAARVSIWFDVKKPVHSFTGREQELSDLHSKLQRGSNKVITITGLGGIGKSQLARMYAYNHANDYDGNVIWINAESYQTISQSFLRLAQDRLGINVKGIDGNQRDIKSIVENVYDFFSKRMCLFIFDNAEEYRTQADGDEGIARFLPYLSTFVYANKPHIIITSRYQNWGNIEVIPLGILIEKDATDFIRAALNIKDDSQNNDIQKLMKISRGFPFALQQAVEYIKERDKGAKFEISDYLKRYAEETEKLLDFKCPDDSSDLYTQTTFAAWKDTTDKIKENNECGKEAGDILDIISYLAPDDIPVLMFLGSELIGDDVKKIYDAIDLLKQYSMINSGKEETVLIVHRLVQQVTRIQLEIQGKKESTVQKTFRLLRESFPFGKQTPKDYSMKRKLLPHLEVFLSHLDNWVATFPEDKEKINHDYLEDLLIWMSDVYSDQSDPKRIIEILERVLLMQEKYYGPDHFEVARTLGNIGNAYGALGDPQKQKDFLERSLQIKEKLYGSYNVEVATTLVNLSNAYGALGDPLKQNDMLSRALAIEEKHYGPVHFEVARTLMNLGNTYEVLGDPQKQMHLLERALAILEKHYDPDYLEIARILGNLGNAYGALGDPQKKKDLLQRSLAIKEKYYGRDHFEVAITLGNLGNAYGALGDPQKEMDLLAQSLAIKEKHYGPNHFEVARTLGNLGNAYGALGDPQTKEKLLERALTIEEQHYGRDHVEVAITLVNLGNANGALGYHQKQTDLIERALAIQESQYGCDNLVIARTLVNLANAHEALGAQKKQNLLQRAAAIQRRHYGCDQFEVAEN